MHEHEMGRQGEGKLIDHCRLADRGHHEKDNSRFHSSGFHALNSTVEMNCG
jgi:hypothetical protein